MQIHLDTSAAWKYNEQKEGGHMPKSSTTKIGLEIDSALYDSLTTLARENGQSRRFLLEQALKFYFEAVVPSQGTVRPEVLAHYRQSAQKNRKLLQLLAK